MAAGTTGADDRGLPKPSAWLDADPDKQPQQGRKHQVSLSETGRDKISHHDCLGKTSCQEKILLFFIG